MPALRGVEEPYQLGARKQNLRPPPSLSLHPPPGRLKDLSALAEAAEMRIFIAKCQKEQVPPETQNSTGLIGTQVHAW